MMKEIHEQPKAVEDTLRSVCTDGSIDLEKTGLTRATARRFLHTLVELGYVHADGKVFRLSPTVLGIGYSYLSSLSLPDLAYPHLRELSGR